ncbi:MAG: TlpA family protein disulfide reductase [Nocardioidaceae bacterium]
MSTCLCRRLVATAAAGLLVAGLASCSTSGASATGNKGYVAGDGSITIISPGNRKPVPTISGPGVGGGRVSISAHTGKVTVINVWGSWCGPCRSEAPDLVLAAHRLKTVDFVGIDMRDDSANAAAFVRAEHIPYPSIRDDDGSTIMQLYGLVHVNALPTTLIVDASGRIAATIYGPTTAITLVDVVHDIRAGT